MSNSFQTSCKYCGRQIQMMSTAAGWKPYETDGKSYHNCATKPATQPQATLDAMVRAIVREEMQKVKA